jgi:hypothetical protein
MPRRARILLRTQLRAPLRIAALGCAALTLGACSSTPSTPPPGPFELTAEASPRRALQTRRFDTADRAELLSASAAALQDLGFHVTESDRVLGFLKASKERSAREHGQELLRGFVLLASFGKLWMPIDLHQRLSASLVVSPASDAADTSEVRVAFHRVVWKGAGHADRNDIPPGEQRFEKIEDPAIHQAFFARLSKSLFLEAQEI